MTGYFVDHLFERDVVKMAVVNNSYWWWSCRCRCSS